VRYESRVSFAAELEWHLSDRAITEVVGVSCKRAEDVSDSLVAHSSYTQKLWMRVKKKAAYLPGC
jgi:hypothetical protein